MIKSSRNEVHVKLPSSIPFFSLLPGANGTLELVLCQKSQIGFNSFVKLKPHNLELKCSETPMVNRDRSFRIKVTNQSECMLVFRQKESIGQVEEIFFPFVKFEFNKKKDFGPYSSLCVRYPDESKNTYKPLVKLMFENSSLESTKPKVILEKG